MSIGINISLCPIVADVIGAIFTAAIGTPNTIDRFAAPEVEPKKNLARLAIYKSIKSERKGFKA